MRRVKTRIVQPGKCGAHGSETFTDSAALSDDRHESSSAARVLPAYPLLNIESGDIVEIKAMPDEEEILKEVRAAFEREPRIDPHHYSIRMEIAEDGALILEGTVKNVAAKKLGLELAAATPGVRAIVDRLKVAPSAPMTDDEICDHVRDAQ